MNKKQELKVSIRMNGRLSARRRLVEPSTHQPKSPLIICVNKPVLTRSVEPRIDNKGIAIPPHSEALSPKYLNKPMPNLKVQPKINNKGIRSPIRSPQIYQKYINKTLPNLSLVASKIDNKGLDIIKQDIDKIINKKNIIKNKKNIRNKAYNQFKDDAAEIENSINSQINELKIVDAKENLNNREFFQNIPETNIIPPTPIKKITEDENSHKTKQSLTGDDQIIPSEDIPDPEPHEEDTEKLANEEYAKCTKKISSQDLCIYEIKGRCKKTSRSMESSSS